MRQQINLIAHLVLASIALQVSISSNNQQGVVHCSSYLDDYFLPTAKLALNKLQQSLATSPTTTTTTTSTTTTSTSATTQNISTQNGSGSVEVIAQDPQIKQQDSKSIISTVVTQSEPETTTTTTIVKELATNPEPNGSEFVKLEQSIGNNNNQPAIESNTIADNTNYYQKSSTNEVSSPETVPNDNDDSSSSPATIVVSSTQATDVDPTSTIGQQEQVRDDQAATASSESGSGGGLVVASDQLPSQEADSPQPIVVVGEANGSGTGNEQTSKSSLEAAKEAEAEAVAAVDASIGFGVDPFNSLAGDPCYDEYGNARYCEPDFENVAFEKQVEVSSECGQPPSRFCTGTGSGNSDQIRQCHICDNQHPKKRHPAAYLTDMNSSNNPTCWVSAPIPSSGSSNQTNEQLRADNVTLTLNLDKKYEITYISMQFCSLKPDSLAIYKSSDFGLTWLPYQFYSSQCKRLYGRSARTHHQPSTSGAHQPATDQSPSFEASCINGTGGSSGGQASRVAFSTLDGRTHVGPQSQLQLDKSAPLQEWTTATNIKIVLDRHQPSWIQANQLIAVGHHHVQTRSNHSQALTSASAPATGADETENSLINPSDTYNYAMSDLTVGGRCKCNGHASHCVHRDGQLQCDCHHNTAGRDCERCAQFHFDRPWARATQLDANPCQPCNCNGHSRKCRFDPELYQLSGRRSGGVCIQCRHNTDGRHCHYCKEGYTRDHSKPMSDKEACKPCNCHPVGSRGRICNQTSGQCPCKEGVTGLECNRCAPGYQQSSSPSEPCIKLPENDINSEPSLSVDSDEQPVVAQSGPQQQSNPPHLVEPELAVDLSSRRFQKPLKVDQIDLKDDNEPQMLDQHNNKQEEDSELDELMVPQRARQSVGGNKQWRSNKQQQQQQYANKYHSQRHRNQPQQDLDEDEAELDNARNGYRLQAATAADDDDQYPPLRNAYHQSPRPQSYLNSYNGPQRFAGHDYVPSSRRRNQAARLPAPIANLDEVDEPQGNANRLNTYSDPIYDDNFNHIQPDVAGARRQATGRGATRLSSSRHRFDSMMNGANELPNLSANSVSCGDCQSNTRRFGLRQFCRLDYAIKGTVLSRQVADDWTKIEVEIQDIFKSPASSAQLASSRSALIASSMSANQQLDNMLQADEPATKPSGSQLEITLDQQQQQQQQPINQSNNQQQQQQISNLQAKFKVGTMQTIWVPTEDLGCKCPKLKTRSTYLLMGSVDTRENSANSIQLDRHGVAFEWKPNLQPKMIKYQRRHSRGRCN